ncbi:MAG: hypothetical protein JXA22_01440 [Candidatus Thermoplasmatota archaeon]|nr:hypothetical protein [Candidatus Thermoplasmatota archaeon]
MDISAISLSLLGRIRTGSNIIRAQKENALFLPLVYLTDYGSAIGLVVLTRRSKKRKDWDEE